MPTNQTIIKTLKGAAKKLANGHCFDCGHRKTQANSYLRRGRSKPECKTCRTDALTRHKLKKNALESSAPASESLTAIRQSDKADGDAEIMAELYADSPAELSKLLKSRSENIRLAVLKEIDRRRVDDKTSGMTNSVAENAARVIAEIEMRKQTTDDPVWCGQFFVVMAESRTAMLPPGYCLYKEGALVGGHGVTPGIVEHAELVLTLEPPKPVYEEAQIVEAPPCACGHTFKLHSADELGTGGECNGSSGALFGGGCAKRCQLYVAIDDPENNRRR